MPTLAPALDPDPTALADPRINLCEDSDIAYWTDALSISEEQLRRTVAEVGDRIEDLREVFPH